MTLNLKELTEMLEVSDLKVNILKSRVLSSFGNSDAINITIEQQCENRKQTNCYACDDEGPCLILRGIMNLYLGMTEKAILEFEKGNAYLRNKDDSWNSIIGLDLLGIAYEISGRRHQALLEYQQAIHIIKVYLQTHANEYTYITKILALKKDLNSRLNSPLSPDAFGIPQTQIDTSNNANHSRSEEDNLNDYLALFAFPIYGTVEAGPDGELHIDHFDTFTVVKKVELQEQAFDVHSVPRTALTDRQITVMTTRAHGWMRVHGWSMNGWDIPFDENDYVLFYRASAASHLDYVIVSNRDPSGEIALIVKRFDAKNNQLLSKSKDTSNPYNPIPLDEDHQIIGIVIAVAKPAN